MSAQDFGTKGNLNAIVLSQTLSSDITEATQRLATITDDTGSGWR